MANRATGKFSKAISDRSGMEFPYKEMVKEWNGSFVHISEFEAKHPQLEIKPHTSDPQGLRDARPDRTETAVPTLLPLNPFEITNGSTTIVVTEPDHGRSTGDTIRFRNTTNVGNVASATITHNAGYTITKVNDNTYNFTTGTTASSTLKGGGGLASAGPVTVTT